MPPDQAQEAAQRVISWMINQGIIMREKTDCGLGDLAHPPGPNASTAHEPVANPTDSCYRLQTCGVETTTKRTVFSAWGNGIELACSACSEPLDLLDMPLAHDSFTGAVHRWADGDDKAAFACPLCGHTKPLPDWTGNCPWGFAHLGFTFWNWHTLTDGFKAEIDARAESRLVHVFGRL